MRSKNEIYSLKPSSSILENKTQIYPFSCIVKSLAVKIQIVVNSIFVSTRLPFDLIANPF